jgi:hypothetical protein
MANTNNRGVDSTQNILVSTRKRSYGQTTQTDNETREKNVEEKNEINPSDKEPTAGRISSTRPPKRKKRKKTRNSLPSSGSKKPLAGMTISVSTLSDKTAQSKNTGSGQDHPDENSTKAPMNLTYSEVCRSCRELGADVIDLVCKRVHVLVCSEAAVRQATQRVRKAVKKGKPLVSIAWLQECQRTSSRVDFGDYRLDAKASDAIRNREERNKKTAAQDNNDDEFEAIPDSGWSEPQDLG